MTMAHSKGKKSGSAPAPKKKSFGSSTKYAEFSKSHIAIGGKKGK